MKREFRKCVIIQLQDYHEMTYFRKAIPNLKDTMERFDEKIEKEFIPANFLTDIERQIGWFRYKFSKISERKLKNSRSISKQLMNGINSNTRIKN